MGGDLIVSARLPTTDLTRYFAPSFASPRSLKQSFSASILLISRNVSYLVIARTTEGY
jgi:hypothetical protein